MPFDTLTPRLKNVATKSLAYCRAQFGANGLKTEIEIDPSISWRPTFHVKPTNSLIIAVEVEEILYPEALKGAAHDIGHFDFPIAVYQACPLDVFQNDHKQTKINLLRNHGFGIITVDEDGAVVRQHPTIPLAQHISPDQLNIELATLNSALKPKFRAAHTSYEANEGQGLQQAGQIIEGLVYSIAYQASKKGMVAAAVPSQPLADMIDSLYACNHFKNYRAALGAARDFVRDFRNTASHAPKNAKQAAEKIRKCRSGFFDAIVVAGKLRDVAQALGFAVRIYTT